MFESKKSKEIVSVSQHLCPSADKRKSREHFFFLWHSSTQNEHGLPCSYLEIRSEFPSGTKSFRRDRRRTMKQENVKQIKRQALEEKKTNGMLLASSPQKALVVFNRIVYSDSACVAQTLYKKLKKRKPLYNLRVILVIQLVWTSAIEYDFCCHCNFSNKILIKYHSI